MTITVDKCCYVDTGETSDVESLNSLLLKYANKTFSYRLVYNCNITWINISGYHNDYLMCYEKRVYIIQWQQLS